MKRPRKPEPPPLPIDRHALVQIQGGLFGETGTWMFDPKLGGIRFG